MDYAKIGLKCGLEIHQQLNTHKLFCECPSQLKHDAPDYVVQRKLRPMAGETGKIDAAAIFEGKKQLYYNYEGYNDTTCLVELDDEPPHTINQEVLETALTVAKMLHCVVPDTLQVMRKTVIDGSNTSGFQRTMLIGTNGYLDIKGERIQIEFVGVEEDAARRTDEDKKSVTYRLDRMGIPLLEITTGPNITSPKQAREVAYHIGQMLRATGKALRGIGTIRQDVNISIKGGARVEIKGVQELNQIPILIEKEVERQQWLINARKPVTRDVRNALPNGKTKFLRPMPGAARMYPETDHPLIPVPRDKLAALPLPELPAHRRARYVELGLSKDLAIQIVASDRYEFFEQLAKTYKKVDPKLIATTLLSAPKEIRKKLGQEMGTFEDQHYERVFQLLNSGKIVKEAVFEVLMDVAQGKQVGVAARSWQRIGKKELEDRVRRLEMKHINLPRNLLIGEMMKELKGRAEPKEIISLLR